MMRYIGRKSKNILATVCVGDEKTGPVVLYGRIKPVVIVHIYSFIWKRVRLLGSFNIL